MAELGPISNKRPAQVTVFSPHLDDAVLSAWHILSASNPVKVVTVFAGVPASGFVTDLDRHKGATESALRVRQRRSEDAAALATVGAIPVHLDLLDVQYSAYEVPDLRRRIAASLADAVAIMAGASGIGPEPDAILNSIQPYVEPQTTVYAPAGIGGHPDHLALSRAVLRLADEIEELHLFADSPYFFRQGLPSWIGGRHNPAADRLIDQVLPCPCVASGALSRRVVTLTAEELAAKLYALRRYTTEFPTLSEHFSHPPTRPEMARYEVFWKVPRA
jgi:LmbE family N-acetylglucosaminyl deacetylase